MFLWIERCSLTSQRRSVSGKRRRNTAWAPTSFSHSMRVWCPARWRPDSIPPIPAKKAETRSSSCGAVRGRGSFVPDFRSGVPFRGVAELPRRHACRIPLALLDRAFPTYLSPARREYHLIAKTSFCSSGAMPVVTSPRRMTDTVTTLTGDR